METSSKLPLNFYTLKSRSWLQPLAINILSTFSEHSLNILSTFSHHSLNILWTLSQHSFNILSTFPQHYVKIQSIHTQPVINSPKIMSQPATCPQHFTNIPSNSINNMLSKFSETLVMTNRQHLSMFQIQIPISTTFLNTDHQNLMRVLR